MTSPNIGNRIPEGVLWAADNGRFSAPHRYTDEKFLTWLATHEAERDLCLFATAPDVLGDAAKTLALSGPMLPRIRAAGYPVALVAQDGLENLPVPWDDFDALFIGGTTEWKLSIPAANLCREAKHRGKWVHMGRVNSLKRLRYADVIGCDSADGTVLKHDVSRPVERWVDAIRDAAPLWRRI